MRPGPWKTQLFWLSLIWRAVALWHGGTVAVGTVAQWHSGTVAHWHSGTVAVGSGVLWHLGTVEHSGSFGATASMGFQQHSVKHR